MQKCVPKPFTLLLFFFLLSNYLSATPDCPIVTSRFQLADGTTSDASATGWYLNAANVASTGIFSVKSNRLHAQELGGVGIWYSRVFSTAGYTDFQTAVKISSEGDMNSSEYVQIYYKINGGAETLLDSRTGNFGTIDFISPLLTGSNVQLVVKIYNYNNGGSQTSKYYIEEYRVFKEHGPCAASGITVTGVAANSGILTCTNPSLGLSATATGSGTTTWSWSGPNGFTSTLQNPTVTAAGTYTVVATNSTGSGSASVTVTENKSAPVITATGGALACGSCVSISATSNVSGATYSWSGPNSFTSTSQNPTVCAAGTYTVTVTNPANGCSAQQSVSVTAGTIATVWLEDFTGLSNGTTSDAGTTGWTTTVTGSGTYSVQNNEYKVSFSGSQGVGVWTSQAIDISSRSNVSFSVNLRSEVASTSDALEAADYIKVYYKLNGGAETLVYEDFAGIGTTTNTTGSITVNSATLSGSTLQVIIKTSNSDPTERYFFDNINVTGSSAGTATVTPTVTGTVTCTATAQLSATASSTVTAWSWTGPNGFTSAQQNPVVNAGGQYIVTATLSSGCTVSATTTVPENKPTPDITASGGTLGCLSVITLNVNSTVSGATYSWTGPNGFTSTAKNPAVSAAGTYTATVTNPANGCTASQSVTVSSGSSAAAIFWNEDFTGLSDGTTSDAGVTAWTASTAGSGTYSVQSNEFKTSLTAQAEGVWTSQIINIAGKSNVTVSVDLRSETASSSDPFESGDYIRVYYKLNGGAETLVYEDIAGIGTTTTGTASITITSASLSGSTLQVIIKTNNSSSTERYYFDNIKLTGSDVIGENATATAGSAITCTTSSVTLLGSSTAGGVTYSWTGPNNFNSTAQNPVVTATGTYTLTVFNPSTGCSGTDTALVALNTTAPGATATANGSISCNAGSSVTLSGTSSTSGVTYSWTGPNNFTSTAQNPTVTTAGAYNLTVTNPVNGCTSTATATVTMSTTSTGSVWLEDFTLANGTTSDAGASSWSVTTNPSTTLFSVLNNEFRMSNSTTTGEGVWTSGSINITGKTNVSISAGVKSSVINNALMNNSGELADYLRFYYKLNNGAEVLFAEKMGIINNHSTTPTIISIAGLSGTNLQIVVRSRATGNDEFYYFDNVQVVATSQSSLNAVATATDILTCTQNSVALTGSSSASGVSYSWTGPNNFASTVQNPSAPAAGIYNLTVTDASTGCTGSDTALVTINNTAPGAGAGTSGALTCNTGSSATLSGTSTTSGVSYSWTGPNNFTSTTQNPAVSTAGTYYLTTTNPVNGCTSNANVAVTSSNTFTSTWLENFTLANGTASDADATPWSVTKNPSTALISVLNNELRISNCTTTGEVVWTSGPIDVAGKTNIAVSTITRSSITNNAVMNETGEYADYIRFYYKLDNGTEVLFAEKKGIINSHSTTPTPLSAAIPNNNNSNLRIVVRSRATGNDEFYYFDNMQIVATGPANVTATAAGGAINCINSSVTLQGSTTASGASYSWIGPNHSSSVQNPVVNTPGIYTFTVALGSCTATATATVSADTTRPAAAVIAATPGSAQITCLNNNVILTGSTPTPGVNYSWSGPAGVISNTSSAIAGTSGTYTITATNPNNGCTSSASKVVSQNIETPTNVTVSNPGSNTQVTCTVPSITLTGSSALPQATYQWSGPGGYTATTANATATAGGSYILTVTNPANGCTVKDTTVLTENKVHPLAIGSSNNEINCRRSSTELKGSSTTPGVSFYWTGPGTFSATTPNVITSTAGNYMLTVTNPANGCEGSIGIEVIQNMTKPVATATNNGPISCTTPEVTLTGSSQTTGLTYFWTGPNSFSSSLQVVGNITNPGTYKLTVTDNRSEGNGCSDAFNTEVIEDFSDCFAAASLARSATTQTASPAINTNAGTASQLTYKAYPNPAVNANAVIEFTLPQNATATVTLYNALGACEKILFKGNAAASQLYKLPVPQQLHAGAYYYIINTGGKTHTGKLVIVK